MAMTIQAAPDDCTGCGICVDVCPAKSKEEVRHKSINMEPMLEHLERERDNFAFFLELPEMDRTKGRPDPRGQRDRLLLHLRGKPADDTVVEERGWTRHRVVQLAVRGQRRVRLRDATGPRPAGRAGTSAPAHAVLSARPGPRPRGPGP